MSLSLAQHQIVGHAKEQNSIKLKKLDQAHPPLRIIFLAHEYSTPHMCSTQSQVSESLGQQSEVGDAGAGQAPSEGNPELVGGLCLEK